MTLVDGLAALQEGALPTNEQTLAFLARLLSSLPQSNELSKSGKGLIADLRSVVESLDQIVRHRNGGEELQQFLWRTKGAAGQLGSDGLKFRWGNGEEAGKKEKLEGKKKSSKAESEKEKGSIKAKVSTAGHVVKRDGTQAAQHLRTLVRLAIVQPELRHIVADVGYMFAEVVDKATGTSIEEARAQLGQVKSATGTFQNVARKALNSSRAQKLAQDSTEGQVDATRLDALKQVAQGAASGMPALAALRKQLSSAFAGGDISIEAIRQELSNGRAVPALEELRKQAELSAGKVAKGQEDLERMRSEIAGGKIPPEVMAALSGSDGEAAQLAENHDEVNKVDHGALLSPTDLVDAAQMIAVANQSFKMVPASTVADIVQSTKDNTQDALKEAWTQDRQDRLLSRAKKLIVDCQVSGDYKDAVTWFIGRVETFAQMVHSKAQLPSTSLDSALSSAAEPLIRLIENFADGRSLRSILETAKTLSIGAKDDAKILAFWTDADAHLRRCLLEEGYVLTSEADTETRLLGERFQALEGEYKRNVAKLVREAAAFVKAITTDELLQRLLKSAKDVLADLTFSNQGMRLPSRALWQDLREHILPTLFDKFGVIPVPRVKYLHPDFDLVIENIALELKHLLPDIFDVRMNNDIHFDFRRMKDSTHAHSLKVKIKGMSIRVYKLAFALSLRMGIKFHDHGIADLLIADFGLSIYLDVPKDPGPHYFIVKKVKAKLGTLQLKIYESNHRILHAMAGGLANGYLAKRILRHFIAMGVTIGLKQLDVQLMTMRLNKDSDAGKMNIEEVRKQMAELRELLRKYHEQAGTLEIDFSRDDIDKKGIGKSIEESHAVRWVKRQVDQTARKEIIRNEWRSNAFDMQGANTIQPTVAKKAAEEVDGPVEETEEAAAIREKPEGPTNATVVARASRELQRAQDDEEEHSNQNRHTSELEAAVESHA